jgi:hypothetical protein
MTIPGWNDPADEERHPRRAEERRNARGELEARLRERRVALFGDESDEDVVDIINAIEEFEAGVSRAGGDGFVNTRESSEPDDQRLVLPARGEDEHVQRYVARVREAADRLG